MTTEPPRDSDPELSKTRPSAEPTPNASDWQAIVGALHRKTPRPSFLALLSILTLVGFASLVLWCCLYVLWIVRDHRLPLDPIEHLAGAVLFVLVVGFFFVTVSAFAKATLDSDRHKRQKLDAMTNKEERAASEASDPCYGRWSKRWRRGFEYVGHELGTALIVAAAVTLMFEFTVRLAEEQEHRDLIAAMKQEHTDMRAEWTQERRDMLAARKQEVQEQIARRDVERTELKKNVFQAIFGQTTDQSVMNEVMETVFHSPLIRRNLEINCLLYRDDNARGTMRARVEMKYHLKNALSKTLVLASKLAAEIDEQRAYERPLRGGFSHLDSVGANADRFISFTVSDEQLKPLVVLTEGDLKGAREKAIDAFTKQFEQRQADAAAPQKPRAASAVGDDEANWATFSQYWKTDRYGFEYSYGAHRQQVLIKRLEIEPGDSVVVDYTYEQTKREADSVDIYTQYPSTNPHVRVSIGEGAGDLHVAVESTLPRQPVRLMPNLQHEGPGETYEYESPAALLPGQLVEINWYPRSTGVAKHDGNTGKAAGR
jgi:hypothetical protein